MQREQEERLTYLLEKFKEDSMEYKRLKVGDAYQEKRTALRTLMNIRLPRMLPEEVLEQQDAFLREEALEKGIVELSEIPTIQEQFGNHALEKGDSHRILEVCLTEHLSLWQGDITRLKVGAIVNAANSQLLGCFVPCHKCIDNAIHSAAGVQLREECSHIMERRRLKYGKRYEEPAGTATLTKAYNLPCDYVIHTVGPVCSGTLTDELCEELKNCYEAVLSCCVENGIRSVAFCCISTGEFRFPKEKAAEIACKTVAAFLKAHGGGFERVIFNVFRDDDREIYEKRLSLL